MTLSETLRERGLVHQFSSETLEEITDGAKRTLYLGVDPTADSFHIGHLQALLVLRRFVEDGHRVILLIGGGTGMIGDPSGKASERELLDDAVVRSNGEALKVQAERIFGGKGILLRNNADWLQKLDLIGFLRDIGKHFTVNSMIKREMVKERLEAESPLSYTEFAYALLQAYDFLHLNEAEQCDLQIGASDQWGNIVSGIDLIRKKTGRPAFGMTSPLLVDKATGRKFGKSEQGTVWLDADKTSPFSFYQFWLNTEDAAVEELLLRMTQLSRTDIDAVLRTHAENPALRSGQKRLAHEVTVIVHGEKEAEQAQRVSEALFGTGSLSELSDADREVLRGSTPSYEVQTGAHIMDVLVGAKLAGSKREARQFLADGAIDLNGETITDEKRTIEAQDFHGGFARLRKGKRAISILFIR